MTGWPRRDRRARAVSSVGTWLSPARWSTTDKIAAVAALVLAVSLFVPWFRAAVRIRTAPSLNGFLINPQGSVSGVSLHRYLWVVFALALLQVVVLAARYAPNRATATLPGSRQLLVLTSGISCVAVLVAAVMKPTMWNGLQLGDGFYIVVSWSYGAVIALSAGLVSFGIALAAIRDQPVPSPSWR